MRCRCGVWRGAARRLPRAVTASSDTGALCSTPDENSGATRRTEQPSFLALPSNITRHAVSVAPCYGNLSSAEEAWYVRQSRAGVLSVSDLPHIFAGPSTATKEDGRDATLALALLLARHKAGDVANVLAFLLSRTTSEQLEVVCRIAELERATVGGLVALAEGILTHFSESHTTRRDRIPASFLVRLVRSLDKLPLKDALLRRVVDDAVTLAPHSVTPYMRYEAFLYTLLAVAERRMPWAELAGLLNAAGMTYEACAYRCDARSERDKDVLFAPPWEGLLTARMTEKQVGRGGEGGVVSAAELLAVTRGAQSVADFPAVTLRCVTAAMPPRLRDYTLDLVALAWLRRMREVVTRDAVMRTSAALDVLHGQRRSGLEWASRVHFVLREGSRESAALLLPRCQTRRQLLTTMQHTRDAGATLSLHALQLLLRLSAREEAYVTLRVPRTSCSNRSTVLASKRDGDRRGCRVGVTPRFTSLLFRVESPTQSSSSSQESCPWLDTPLTQHDTAVTPHGNKVTSQLWRPAQIRVAFEHALGLVRRGDGSEADTSCTTAAGDAPVETILTRVPAQRVDRVVAAMPQLNSDMLSWWLLLELRAGRLSVVPHLLHLAARRGVVPEWGVLLALLDSAVARVRDHGGSARSTEELCALLRTLLTNYAAAMRTVCRVAVERAAHTVADQSTPSCGDATKLCFAVALLAASQGAGRQSVALLSLCHFERHPSSEGGAAETNDAVAAAVRRVIEDVMHDMSEDKPRDMQSETAEGVQGAVSLHHDVFLPLHCAVTMLTRRAVELDVFVQSVHRRSVAWWGACGMSRQLPVTRRLLRLGLTELWPLALNEARWSTSQTTVHPEPSLTVHQALRLTALGAPKSDLVLTAIRELQHRLTGPPRRDESAASNATHGRAGRRRMRGVWNARLVYTLACAAEAMRGRGEGQAVLRLLPPRVSDLPPLLRLVRLRAMREEGEFAELAALSLPQELHAVQTELLQNATDRSVHAGRRRGRRRRRTCKPGRRTVSVAAEEEALLDAAFAACHPLHALLLARQDT